MKKGWIMGVGLLCWVLGVQAQAELDMQTQWAMDDLLAEALLEDSGLEEEWSPLGQDDIGVSSDGDVYDEHEGGEPEDLWALGSFGISSALVEEGLSGPRMLSILEQFAPLVYLHSKEVFCPESFDEYMSNCFLISGSKIYAPGTFNGAFLGSVTDPEAYLTPINKKKTYRGKRIENKRCQAPCYANVVPNWEIIDGRQRLISLVIQYYFFYAFNGPTIPFTNIGVHEGDWEHINLYVEVVTQEETESLRIRGAFYAAHQEKKNGKNVTPKNMKFFEGTHPVVYVSLNGHASHPHLFRLINMQLDAVNDKGARWPCWEHMVYLGTAQAPSVQAPWLSFAGKCGKGGPRMPAAQNTWRQAQKGRVLVAEIEMRLGPLKGEQSRASKNFSLDGKVPKRIRKLYWEVQHPLAQDIEFSVNQERGNIPGTSIFHNNKLIKDKKAVYGPLKGAGSTTGIASSRKDLYISRVHLRGLNLNPKDTVKLRIYGIEEQ